MRANEILDLEYFKDFLEETAGAQKRDIRTKPFMLVKQSASWGGVILDFTNPTPQKTVFAGIISAEHDNLDLSLSGIAPLAPQLEIFQNFRIDNSFYGPHYLNVPVNTNQEIFSITDQVIGPNFASGFNIKVHMLGVLLSW